MRLSYNEGRNSIPEQEALREMQQHGGEIVARSLDGTVSHCYAKTYEALFALLTAQNIATDQVVLDIVPEIDVAEIF